MDLELNAVGLNCPMPLLKLKQQLNKMSVGQVIRVTTSDIGSVRDFGAFVKQVGHSMLSQSQIQRKLDGLSQNQSQATDEFEFVIRKER